jgi:hypothetical protein
MNAKTDKLTARLFFSARHFSNRQFFSLTRSAHTQCDCGRFRARQGAVIAVLSLLPSVLLFEARKASASLARIRR